MPRTTKDTEKQTNKSSKTSSKQTTLKAEKSTGKNSISKTKAKAVSTKSTAKASSAQKAASKKSVAKKETTKSASKKKSTVSTKTSSARTKKTTSTVHKNPKTNFIEYYDLPYRYNQTTVKILAQTPKMLFVYWDISDEDRLAYTTKYGEDFFSKTRPVLLVHNETMNYTFEVEINDFANSWYLQVADANCKYVIELGRRPNLYQDTIKEDYIHVTSSNEIDAPNDHILFEKFNPNVVYKDVKTGKVSTKNFSSFSRFKNMQEIYGIYDLYKQIYKNELFDEMVEGNFTNPSSLSSSQFK